MKKGRLLPTFEDAPQEMLPSDIIAFKMRMEQLDRDHSRARGPTARRRIEGKMRELRAELRKLERLDRELDAAAKKWWEETQATFVRILGPDSGKPS